MKKNVLVLIGLLALGFSSCVSEPNYSKNSGVSSLNEASSSVGNSSSNAGSSNGATSSSAQVSSSNAVSISSIVNNSSVEASELDHLVIYEINGGGEGTTAVIANDYVVIYNGTANTVDLSQYYLMYGSALSTNFPGATPSGKAQLSGSLPSGKYALVITSAGAVGEKLTSSSVGNGNIFVDVSTSGKISISGTGGRMGLVLGATSPTTVNAASMIDFVGFGFKLDGSTKTPTSAFEGAGPAVSDLGVGCGVRRGALADTNNNATDFISVNISVEGLNYLK